MSTLQPLRLKQTLWFHLLGIPAAYFLTGYFSNFYPKPYQFILLSLIFQLSCPMIAFLFLRDTRPLDWRKSWTSLLALTVAACLVVAAVGVSLQFPGLFNRRILFMEASRFPMFMGLAALSMIGTLALITSLERNGVAESLGATRFFHFIQANRAGVLLFLIFFGTYFVFAQSINFPKFNTLDQYFDSDISEWITRLSSHPQAEMPTIRAVHPAVMLILRSLVWVTAAPINGNKLQAIYLLLAFAGASCVFLVWLIVKGRSGNTTYALVFASILGAGTSHLLLGSITETYIFSAFALIYFCHLMQSDRLSLKSTIPAGVLIFGITITNLVQACVLYFLKQPRIKVIAGFITAVVAITLLLNVLQVRIFPKAMPLYVLSNLRSEQNYKYDLFETSWKPMGRVNLISRAILLYGIVAPTPYILKEELGAIVPNFRTFEIGIASFHVAGYKGLGDVAAKFWMVLVGLAFVLFTMRLVQSPKEMSFPLSLLLCLGFSFVLHTLYGDDPLLYSPDWVYALVLFVASSYEKWADKKIFQIVLIVFLGMILYINASLIRQIMEVSLPYYGR